MPQSPWPCPNVLLDASVAACLDVLRILRHETVTQVAGLEKITQLDL